MGPPLARLQRLAAGSVLPLGLLLVTLLGGCAPVRTNPTGSAAPHPSPDVPVPVVEQEEASTTPTPEVAPEPPDTESEIPREEPAAESLGSASGPPPEGTVEPEIDEGEQGRSPLDERVIRNPQLGPEEIEETEPSLVRSPPPTYDIPIVLNDKVKAWVDRYSKEQLQWFVPGLVRSGRYLPMFRQIFKEEGVPQDLVYMAHVESNYKTTAYSRARAKGIFQFIASTGRRYGLRIDFWVDERSDPEKSARASAAYLKKLYGDFGDWYLAMAAYNAGEGRVRRAIAKTGSRDFWEISRRYYLRRETRNYVPAVLAATLISKDPRKYGIRFKPDPLIVYDTIRVEGAVDLKVLARCAGTDFETMKKLNPALRRHQSPPNATTDVRVPVGRGKATLTALAEVPESERVLYVRHQVRNGDTLWVLARQYRVSVSSIQQANRMGRRTLLRVGRILVIPTVAAEEPFVAADSDVVTYKVRRGDTLSAIAKRYGTTSSAIAAASGIKVHKILRIGERLVVVPGARSASSARRLIAANREPTTGGATGGGSLVHTVRRGDTLWRIASRYRTSVQALCTLNRISRHDTLYPGTRLTIRK